MSIPQIEMAACTATTSILSTQTDFTTSAIQTIAPCTLIQWTEMPDKSGNAMTARSGTWADVITRLRTAGEFPSKEKCPLIKLARFGDKRSTAGSLRHNANVMSITGIEGDYDGEVVTMQYAAAQLQQLGVKAALYPSPSSTPRKPRWRVLSPLSQPCTPQTRQGFVSRLNGILRGILAPESFTLSQSFFFGATPTNEYEVLEVAGRCIDERADLEMFATGRAGASACIARTLDGPPKPINPAVTLDMARSMLDCLDPECGRAEWVSVGMGMKHQFGDNGFALWDSWSKESERKYPGPREMKQQWVSFQSDKPHAITIGTVISMARAAGWSGHVDDIQGLFVAVNAVDYSRLSPAGIDSATGEMINLQDARCIPFEVDIANLTNVAPPPPDFLIDVYLPADTVTLLGAHGGTGKTTLALYLAVCSAMGLQFFNQVTKAAKVLFYSAEDDAALLRWRLATVCQRLNVDPVSLSQQLTVIDASETDSVLYVEASQKGVKVGQPTDAFQKLIDRVAASGSQIVILDNASDVYGADENSRGQVRGFIRLLTKLVRPMHGAVLLLAHVDKFSARTKNTESYSGSTAWHNSVRSRLFLSETAGGNLFLEHLKSNRGKKADPLNLRFDDGLIVMTQTGSAQGGTQSALESTHAPRIVSILHEFYQRGEFVSTSPTAHTNAFKVLSGDRDFPKMTKVVFYQLMRDSERLGWIEREAYRTAQRKASERWRANLLCAPSAPSSNEGADI